MTMDVRGPNGIVVRFPDGTDAATIDKVMREATGQAAPAAAPPGGASPAVAAPVPTGELRPYEPGFFENIGNRLYDAAEAIGLPGSRMRRDVQGVDAAVRGAADTATFGLADEIAAGMGAVTGVGGQAGNYEGNLEAQRAIDERDAAVNPTARMAGQVGGALATLPITGSVNLLRAPQAASAAASAGAKVANAAGRAGAKMGNAAATGAVYGGLYGAGSAEGGLGERAAGGATGAVTGGVLGAGMVPVVGGATHLASKVFGRPGGVASAVATSAGRPVAERQVAAAIKKDAATQGIPPSDAVDNIATSQQVGLPTALADIGETTRSLGRAAADISPQGRDVLNRTLDPRHATQGDRVISAITKYAPGTHGPETLRLLQEAAKRTNRARYNVAYAKGAAGVWSPELASLTASREVQSAIRDAVKRGQSEAVLRGQKQTAAPFVAGPDGTMVPAPGVTPTLEFWDQVQRSLRDMGKRQSGERMAENAALFDRLRGRLNSVLDKAVPEFNEARLGAFRFFGAEDAMEAGVKFAHMRSDVLKMDAAKQAIAKMTEAERGLFAEGYATQFIQDIRNIRDSGAALNVIDRVFNSKTAKEQFRLAMGPRAHEAMEVTVRLEDIMRKTKNAVQSGSHTAQYQLAAQALLGASGGAAGYYFSGGDLTTTAFVAILTGLATKGVKSGANAMTQRANEQNARRVAELLASNDPQVVREALRRVASHPTWMENIRAAHARLTRALIPSMTSGGGAAPALVDTGGGSDPAQAQD